MPELTTEEKEAIILQSIKIARENLYYAEISDQDEDIIGDLQTKVDNLEAKYEEQFGE
jgi:predicted proteasome-type protease